MRSGFSQEYLYQCSLFPPIARSLPHNLLTRRAYYHLEESLRLSQEQGDVPHASLGLIALEVIVSTQGDQELARSLHQAHDRGTLGLFLITTGDFYH